MVDTQVQNEDARPRFNRRRILQLSQPKAVKTIWITSFGPRVQWGTQEMLWPVNSAAMSAPCTPRLSELSGPKRNFQSGMQANSGRPQNVESSIWRVSRNAMNATPSPRVTGLAHPKRVADGYVEDRPNHVYSCGRPSAIWEVSKPAMTGRFPDSMESLARPKSLPDEFLLARDVKTEIRPQTMNAVASERLEVLAGPKNRPEGPFREPEWNVSDGARSATPSSRCLELSRSKPVADGYLPSRANTWCVSKGARKYTATQRVSELAQPNVRASMDHVQFDPNAFMVKETALKFARCTPRTEELAQPIKR